MFAILLSTHTYLPASFAKKEVEEVTKIICVHICHNCVVFFKRCANIAKKILYMQIFLVKMLFKIRET